MQELQEKVNTDGASALEECSVVDKEIGFDVVIEKLAAERDEHIGEEPTPSADAQRSGIKLGVAENFREEVESGEDINLPSLALYLHLCAEADLSKKCLEEI